MAKNRSVVEPEVPTISTGGEAPESLSKPQGEGRRRVIIEGVTPEVDGGRFPAKRTVGDAVRVEADIFTDGHDSVAAVLRFRHESSSEWSERPMQALVNDRWFCEFPVSELGRYRYTIQAWVDHWETWRRDLLKRIQADSDTPLDYLIGAELIQAAAERAGSQPKTEDSRWLREQADLLKKNGGQEKEGNRSISISRALSEAMLRHPDRQFASELDRDLTLVVDPVRARFSSWYE